MIRNNDTKTRTAKEMIRDAQMALDDAKAQFLTLNLEGKPYFHPKQLRYLLKIADGIDIRDGEIVHSIKGNGTDGVTYLDGKQVEIKI